MTSFIDPINNPEHRVPVEVLRLQADRLGDKVFLRDEQGDLSYGAVNDLADRHASGYSDLGVADGSTVALLMENSAKLATTAMGINRSGGVWSPLSTEYRGEWLGEMLAGTAAKVLVADRHLLPEIARLGKYSFEHLVVNGGGASDFDLPGVTIHDLADFDQHDPAAVRTDFDYGDTSAVLWTSGTTGPSKGVMQPHAVWTLWPQHHNDKLRGGVAEDDVFYYCMPMYNSGGWVMNIFPALIAGATACTDQRFSISDFWNRTRHYGANHTMSLGAMTVYLFQAPAQENDADNEVRTMVMNPVIPQLMEPFMARFGIERIWSGFGQSEIMGATFYTSDMSLKPGSCGYTTDDDLVETKLLDANDHEVGLGETGEICVRPRVPFTIFTGYYGRPEETLQTFRNQWHHTGDLGRRDEDGEIFFVDRKKDSIRHKGRNISTFEVEHIARQYPGVAQVAAVGVKTAELEHEEELMIFLQLADKEGFDALEFCKFMDDKAPYFFVPRFVEVIDEWPMTPTNKIQKFVLRDRGPSADAWDAATSADGWTPRRPDKASVTA